MESKNTERYEILRQLAVSGTGGAELSELTKVALEDTAELVGLSAAAIYLWNESKQTHLSVLHSESDASHKRLISLEEELLVNLRNEKQIVSAYLSFGGEAPMQSFMLPLHNGAITFGAVIGILEGAGRLVTEDLFFDALSAVLSLTIASREVGLSKDLIDRERLSAVQETAVTVNHEINNPLTAILGNIQLLLLKRQDLDADLITKLKIVEASALKIKDVTQRLLRLTSVRSTEYTEGTRMLDLSGDES